MSYVNPNGVGTVVFVLDIPTQRVVRMTMHHNVTIRAMLQLVKVGIPRLQHFTNSQLSTLNVNVRAGRHGDQNDVPHYTTVAQYLRTDEPPAYKTTVFHLTDPIPQPKFKSKRKSSKLFSLF